MPAVRARTHDARSALGLAALAFGIRLAWGLAAGVTPGGAVFDDAAWYHLTATALAAGGGYVNPFTALPTAAWPPGYPFVLALGYRVAGASPTTAVVMNAAFGALTCLLVWRLGLRLGGPRVGLVAAALLACFPSQILFAALVLTETLFTCLVCGLVLAAVALVTGARPAPTMHWMLWGLAVGATALVRAESVVLVLVPTAALSLCGDPRTAARACGAVLAGVVIALAPWTLRNARVFGTFVPTSTGFGRTLWIGHNPAATGGMNVAIQDAMQTALDAAGAHATTPAGELAVDRLLGAQAVTFALAHPAREAVLAPLRVFHLFRGDHVWQAWYEPGTPRLMPSPSARRLLAVVGNLYFAVVGVLAAVGWCVRRTEPRVAWRVVDAFVVVWIALFAAIYGDPRFHHVLIPFAGVLAAVALERAARGRPADDSDATRAA